jgi:hypothetical protein
MEREKEDFVSFSVVDLVNQFIGGMLPSGFGR